MLKIGLCDFDVSAFFLTFQIFCLSIFPTFYGLSLCPNVSILLSIYGSCIVYFVVFIVGFCVLFILVCVLFFISFYFIIAVFIVIIITMPICMLMREKNVWICVGGKEGMILEGTGMGRHGLMR